MAWTVDKKSAKIHASWKPKDKDGNIAPHQKKWNDFMDQLSKGRTPKEAADRIGDSKFTVLDKKTGQAEIRLGGKHRAAFVMDETNKKLTQVQLGGHT